MMASLYRSFACDFDGWMGEDVGWRLQDVVRSSSKIAGQWEALGEAEPAKEIPSFTGGSHARNMYLAIWFMVSAQEQPTSRNWNQLAPRIPGVGPSDVRHAACLTVHVQSYCRQCLLITRYRIGSHSRYIALLPLYVFENPIETHQTLLHSFLCTATDAQQQQDQAKRPSSRLYQFQGCQ